MGCTNPGMLQAAQLSTKRFTRWRRPFTASISAAMTNPYQVAIGAKTVAVLGCKTEAHAGQPAFYVPEYLHSKGIKVIPIVTNGYPVTHVLGQPILLKVSQLNEPVDILDVFRKPSDLPAHLEDILSAPHRPKCVWLQSGITHPEFEQKLREAGIQVVSNRCLMVDHQAAVASGATSAGGEQAHTSKF